MIADEKSKLNKTIITLWNNWRFGACWCSWKWKCR